MVWRRKLAAALCLALALTAVACGSGDDDGEGAAPSGDAGSESGSESGTGSDTGATEGPDTPEPRPLDEETSVTILPVVAAESFAPVYLAEHFGEFERENLDVTISELPSNDTFVALVRGDAQLTVGGLNAAFFNLVEGGTDVRWLANVHQQSEESSEGLWVRREVLGDDGELDADELDGMRIALGTSGIVSTSALAVDEWLEENGSDLGDVEVQSIGGNDVVVALEQGSTDAGYVLSPAWQTVEESGCCEMVTPRPPLAASTYTMTADFMENERQTARAIMRALTRTVRTYLQGDYHADPEVLEGLVETLEVPEEVVIATPSLVFDPDMGFDSAMVEDIQQVWLDAGDVLEYSDPIPADEVVDTSVVDEVLEGQ
jgi:NitT/TauT family transport system substrate-binding protein